MARIRKILKPISCGQVDGTDRLNCTVRALANCTDMPITEAKNLLAKHGRKEHEGCTLDVFENAYHEAGLSFVGFFGSTRQSVAEQHHSKLHTTGARLKGITLETFCKTFNKGSYVVVVSGHAVCIKGGHIIDQQSNVGNKSVMMAWKKPFVVKG